jgi:hypothetical protein
MLPLDAAFRQLQARQFQAGQEQARQAQAPAMRPQIPYSIRREFRSKSLNPAIY